MSNIGAGHSEDLRALDEYFRAHELLPRDETWLSDPQVVRLSAVLSNPVAERDAKKKAMILLAHSRNPMATVELGRHAETIEASLRRFAAFALDESVGWTEGGEAFPTQFM